ncbi:MAG: hypothetical protein GW855_01990 [Erythrobacter sp.]|nr:hypothetical protein [Erythrobacter sp.]NCQ64342.1 hypothetical protein [Alphaproteobacteria bacterium]
MRIIVLALIAAGLVGPANAQSDFSQGEMAWEDMAPSVRQKAYERVIRCAGIAKGDETLSSSAADKAKYKQEMTDLMIYAREVSGKDFGAMVPDLAAQTKAYFAVLESGDTAKGIAFKGDCGMVLAAARQ